MLLNDNQYLSVVEEIKSKIQTARYKATVAVNSELILLYHGIGKTINEHKEWGNKFIDNLSKDIAIAYPGVKGYSVRNLKYMAKFAAEFTDIQFVQQAVAQIPWGHIVVLLDSVPLDEQRRWYVLNTIKNGCSRNVLVHQIESKLYERQVLANKVSNFERMLPAPQSELAV